MFRLSSLIICVMLITSCGANQPKQNIHADNKQSAKKHFNEKLHQHDNGESLIIYSVVYNGLEFNNLGECSINANDAGHTGPLSQYINDNKLKSIRAFNTNQLNFTVDEIECSNEFEIHKLQLGDKYIKVNAHKNKIVYIGEIEIYEVEQDFTDDAMFTVKIRDNKYSDIIRFNEIAQSTIDYNQVLSSLMTQQHSQSDDKTKLPTKIIN